MKSSSVFRCALPLALALAAPPPAASFCGFYVASGDAKLFNHASQVVFVRDGDHSVITMASDYQGEPAEFALVVPVPVVLKKEQVRVVEPAVIGRVDAFSAPRLVEYSDPDPCPDPSVRDLPVDALYGGGLEEMEMSVQKSSAHVKIEARYTVDEYDILILSASQSDGLARWLEQHHYRIPSGAERALDVYLKQGMKFFVAKVNLSERKRLGVDRLRPLQMAFDSPRFMLPIRLGMVNADGPQEMFVYALAHEGRVECVSYRTVKLPSDAEIPEYVQADFSHFYRDLFAHQVGLEAEGVVFTEYCWNTAGCDPCAAPPLTAEELASLGVRGSNDRGAPMFLTRLHVRYDRDRFPEDLALQITSDTQNFQGRYIVRHEWKGSTNCDAGEKYLQSLPERHRRQAETLAQLTGWPLDDVRSRMGVAAFTDPPAWWERMWQK